MWRSAMLSALLVACLPLVLSAATIDVTTQGNWIGTYGGDGYILSTYDGAGGNGTYYGGAVNSNDRSSLPSYITSYDYTGGGGQQYKWDGATTDVRALQDPANPSGTRVSATAFSGGDWFMTLNVGTAANFKLSVYSLDWDNFNGRDITLTVNGDAVRVNSTGAGGGVAGGYVGGEWVTWTVNAAVGPLLVNIHQNAGGGSNSTISGIAFESVPEPASAALLGLGALGLAFVGRRRKRAS